MDINTAKEVITAAAQADDTVIMEGLHGIGKSTIVQQYAKENKMNLIELFLSHQEVGDLIGMPKTIEQDGETLTTWTKPIWLQRMIDASWPKSCTFGDLSFTDEALADTVKKYLDITDSNSPVSRDKLNEAYATHYNITEHGLHLVTTQTYVACTQSRHNVLFLDELNRAPIDVRQSALQLVLERKIHEHELPAVQGTRCVIVAAINPSDDYQVDELDPALLDRFLHINVEADIQAWLKWARESNVNQIVVDFLTEHPDRLHYTPSDGKPGATPRSWAKLGSFMDNIDKTPQEIHFQIFKGKVGSELGSQFLSFFKNYVDVVKIEDIEALVKKHSKKESNIEKLGDKVKKLMEKAEAIQKTEMAHQLMVKYITLEAKETLPLMAYLYGLELEILTAFLKSYKETEAEKYTALSKLDAVINNKGLFKKIVSKLKS